MLLYVKIIFVINVSTIDCIEFNQIIKIIKSTDKVKCGIYTHILLE